MRAARRKKAQDRAAISEEEEAINDSDALAMAAMQGSVDTVSELLESGVSVDNQDSIGVGPLHWAAFCGHASVIKRLLDAQGNIHIQDREGRTPLHVAAYERSEGQQKRTIFIKYRVGES